MKTASLSQLLQIKSEDAKAKSSVNKNALETIPAGTAFSQLWKTMMHSKESWQGAKTKKIQGEIEIPIAIQKKAVPKTENKAATRDVKGQERITKSKTHSAQTPKEGKAAFESGKSKNVPLTKAQEVGESSPVMEEETTSGLSAEKVKQVSAGILDALSKSDALPSVKAGDWAKIEVSLAKGPRKNSGKKEISVKTAKTKDTRPEINKPKSSVKSGNKKMELIFKYAGKKGWQIQNNTPAAKKGSIWKVRLVFQDETGTAGKTSVLGKGNSAATVSTSGKDVLVNVLSVKEIENKSAAQKGRTQMTVKFTAEGAIKNSASSGAKNVQTVTFPLNEKSGLSDTVNQGKAGRQAAQSKTETAGNPVANGSEEPTSSEGGTAKTGNAALATGKKVIGAKNDALPQNEWTGLSRNHLKSAQGLSGRAINTKGSGTVSSRVSVLIERIESLLAQAAKSKNGAKIKMEFTESPFGKLNVGFDDKENRLSVVVESEKAKAAFLRLAPLIQSGLADKGYLLNDVQVAVGQSAVHENRQETGKKRNINQNNIRKTEGKEGDDHEITTAVKVRNFGYNTLEVTA